MIIPIQIACHKGHVFLFITGLILSRASHSLTILSKRQNQDVVIVCYAITTTPTEHFQIRQVFSHNHLLHWKQLIDGFILELSRVQEKSSPPQKKNTEKFGAYVTKHFWEISSFAYRIGNCVPNIKKKKKKKKKWIGLTFID